MQQEIKENQAEAHRRLELASDNDAVSLIRSEILGKKGSLGAVLRGMGKLPADERPKVGQLVNEVKSRIEGSIDEALARLDAAAEGDALEAGRFDLTRPGRQVDFGASHPLKQVERYILACLERLGFTVADGPQVEHDWYNFEALNIPEDHPARDMQDTFFLAPRVVLRTHTSNVQIRTMVKRDPPVRIVAPGMVFRKDDVDQTHSPVFHQIEGLWIDEKSNIRDLKGVLKRLAISMFGPDAELRFRPSFFPFTEPSTEVDVRFKDSKSGWLEILGAGMVDPAVLEAVGYDPDKVQGFAFGLGIERIAILRWGIDDIRTFYENDTRFLRQFGRGAL